MADVEKSTEISACESVNDELSETLCNAEADSDGGWHGWLSVFGAFLALYCTFGQLNAFGTFQTWYGDHQLRHLAPSTISWIGSLQLWVFFFSVRKSLLDHAFKELTLQPIGRYHWSNI